MKAYVKLAWSHLGLFNVFTCPICRRSGQFKEFNRRQHAQCRRCRSLERHRLQYLVLKEIFKAKTIPMHKCIQFAPDPITPFLRSKFRHFLTADISKDNVDVKMDLRAIGLKSESLDCVFASHVLEHIDCDDAALEEIYRILKPGGVAVLPVPVVAETTIEYPNAVASEFGHVRAPGRDYFSKYERVFDRVTVKASADYPSRFQLYACEDRTKWPNERAPYLKPMPGTRHSVMVPIAWKKS
jgi:SAM-dependent methyltransferase